MQRPDIERLVPMRVQALRPTRQNWSQPTLQRSPPTSGGCRGLAQNLPLLMCIMHISLRRTPAGFFGGSHSCEGGDVPTTAPFEWPRAGALPPGRLATSEGGRCAAPGCVQLLRRVLATGPPVQEDRTRPSVELQSCEGPVASVPACHRLRQSARGNVCRGWPLRPRGC